MHLVCKEHEMDMEWPISTPIDSVLDSVSDVVPDPSRVSARRRDLRSIIWPLEPSSVPPDSELLILQGCVVISRNPKRLSLYIIFHRSRHSKYSFELIPAP